MGGSNGVPSIIDFPKIDPILDPTHSNNYPIVILDGIAWGLTMISGVIPQNVYNKSSCLYNIPTVPF